MCLGVNVGVDQPRHEPPARGIDDQNRPRILRSDGRDGERRTLQSVFHAVILHEDEFPVLPEGRWPPYGPSGEDSMGKSYRAGNRKY